MELASPSSSSPTTPSSSEDSSSLASSAKVLSYPHGWTHERVPHFGSRLSVVDFGGRQPFFIGTQVAALLKRETFNMYRSMKIKMVDLDRATAEQVEFLCQVGAVRAGTHSVTLIPYQEGLYFIAGTQPRTHAPASQPHYHRNHHSLRFQALLRRDPCILCALNVLRAHQCALLVFYLI